MRDGNDACKMEEQNPDLQAVGVEYGDKDENGL